LEKVSSASVIPVALGFGISEPAHVRAALGSGASGVIEGSRLISMYGGSDDPRAALDDIARHARGMKSATSIGFMPCRAGPV
ncbi:MAG: tryptophan synthase subunit alpha, partial [Thermoplasmata archaeon]|nr:tryptophan synthase subunit alpha [Thermoplasmata archaeon]